MFATNPLSHNTPHSSVSGWRCLECLSRCLGCPGPCSWDRLIVFLWMLATDDKYEWTALVIVTFLSVSLKRIRNSLSVIIVMSKLHKKSIYPFLDFYQKHRWDIIHWPASPTAGCRLDKALKTWAQKTIWVPTQRDGASLTLACPLSSLWRWKSRRAELTSDQAQQVDWEGNPFIFPLCTPRHPSQQNFPVSSWLIYPPGKSFIILFWLRLHS